MPYGRYRERPDIPSSRRRPRRYASACPRRWRTTTPSSSTAGARELLAALPGGSQVFVSSSMPIRDVDAWAGRAAAVRVLANRGINGIDGVVSSALGAALATGLRTAVLLGDLALLHDLGGLVAAARLGAELTLVVVDNDGGGIFSFLPIASQ